MVSTEQPHLHPEMMTTKTGELMPEPDWTQLTHAYGLATDVPQMLSMLTSSFRDERKEAVNELLCSRAYHQGDVFNSTPWVIRYVLPLLDDSESSALVIYPGDMLSDEIIHFCRICGEAEATTEVTQQIAAALNEGKTLFANYVSSGRKQTANDATWLVEFCERSKS